jgi:hypothetical protein
VNLLPVVNNNFVVIDFLTLTSRCNSFLHVGIEAGDEV